MNGSRLCVKLKDAVITAKTSADGKFNRLTTCPLSLLSCVMVAFSVKYAIRTRRT